MTTREPLEPATVDEPTQADPAESEHASRSGETAHWLRLATEIVVSAEGRIHREALRALLATQPDFRVLGAAGTSTDTLSLCAKHRPQVVVLSLLQEWPPGLSPIEAIRMVSPQTRVLALAPHGADRCSHLNPVAAPMPGLARLEWTQRSTCLQAALGQGALAAIDADAEPASLFTALRAVAKGQRWGAGEARHGHAKANGNGHALSPRERKVARLVGRGASNKEIAASLAISDLTVKKHVGSILQKLGLHDRLQLGVCVARNPTAFADDRAHD